MPTAALATLAGAGTFSTIEVPALNSPITLAAQGTVSLPVGANGFLVVVVVDEISGVEMCGITDLIRPAEKISGSKAFNIFALTQFATAVSLQVSVRSLALDGVSAGPVISAASLGTFSAEMSVA
jgi:hypothetical protein